LPPPRSVESVVSRSCLHGLTHALALQVTDSSVKVSFMELYNEELTDLLR